MKQSSDKISKEQAKEALLRSGYLIESRLEKVLTKKHYSVKPNTVYPDPDTGKSRELDLYAISTFPVETSQLDFIFAVLLIECVNNPQPIVFITKEPEPRISYNCEEVKLSGIPVKVIMGEKLDRWVSLPYSLKMQNYHHYYQARIATQFCSFAKKKQTKEWMATGEAHFDSFSKLCVALEYFVDKHYKNWSFRTSQNINIDFYYPAVVVQGELFDARPSKKSIRLTKKNHIQYRHSHLVGTKATNYQIDVVTERFFPKYLELIHREAFETARLLKRHLAVISYAIRKIVSETDECRSSDEIRAAMEL